MAQEQTELERQFKFDDKFQHAQLLYPQYQAPLNLLRFVPGKKKERKDDLLRLDTLRWDGGLTREGVGAKSLVCSLKLREDKFSGGIPRDNRWKFGVPKSLRIKSLCAIF